MRIVVIGGTGLIGSKVFSHLEAGGHEVVSASPDSGVNTITGEGVAEALTGSQVVVDVSNSRSYDDDAVMEFFESSTRNLLAAEAEAGVEHHVALSIVGTDRLPDSGYYRAKLVQENLIKASGQPFTIVRSTQFFEFLRGIADAGTDDGRTNISSGYVQPISAEDLSSELAKIAVGPPANGTVEIAGPESFRMSEIVQRYLGATGDRRVIVSDRHARYFGAELSDDSLMPLGEPIIGEQTFAEWLGEQAMSSSSSAASR